MMPPPPPQKKKKKKKNKKKPDSLSPNCGSVAAKSAMQLYCSLNCQQNLAMTAEI